MPTTTVTPITYKWTDDPLYATSGTNMMFNELKDIFKKILVDGMGSKPALGWTLQFDDADGIVFRSPSDLFSFGIRQGSGTGNFSDWSEWYFAEDFLDSTTFSNDFYGGCFMDWNSDNSYIYEFMAFGYEDTFIFSSTRLRGSTYFSGSWSSTGLNQGVMSLKYDTYTNDSKPYVFWGTTSYRVDTGGNVYKNIPLYNETYSFAYLWTTFPSNGIAPFSDGYMTKPFNTDGSIYTDYAGTIRVLNMGFNSGSGYWEWWTTIQDVSLFLPFILASPASLDGADAFSSGRGFYGVVPYFSNGLTIGQTDGPGYNGYSYGDTLQIGGRDYYYYRTPGSNIYIHAGNWEYPI